MLADHPIDVMILATDLGVAREFNGDRIGLLQFKGAEAD
jgi:hypothetical protein